VKPKKWFTANVSKNNLCTEKRKYLGQEKKHISEKCQFLEIKP
jgi:hypothetical protein